MSTISELTNQLTEMNNATSRTYYDRGRNNLGNSDIGKDGFMQLMLTQMRLQNPMEPMDSTQQLMQQAQFSQIEQLQSLNQTLTQSMELTQASNFVGHTVDFKTRDDGPVQSGRVDSVSFANGAVKLNVAGQDISPGQVLKLHAATTP